MPRTTRAPLPHRPIPQEIVGQDTQAQAAENRRRIESYLDMLASTNTALPADPTQPKRLGIAQVAREAGVSIGVLRPGHPLRKQIEDRASELGLAIIHTPPARDRLTVTECHKLFRSLAPAKAGKLGIKSEAMINFVDRLFELITHRAKGDDEPLVAPVVSDLRSDAEAGLLDLPAHVLRIIDEFDDWVTASKDPGNAFAPEHISAMVFHDLLRLGMENAGLTQGRAAEIAELPQPTLHKWLHEHRFPNTRSFENLRRLSTHCGLPPEALIASITRTRTGDGIRFRSDDFPTEYRGRSSKRLRDAVKARLTDTDFELSTEAFRSKIADLCRELQRSFDTDRARKRMRDANRIDRSLFTPRLEAELAGYREDLHRRGKSAATMASYIGHLEGFFSFALSEHAPHEVRLAPAQASIAFAGSRSLWDAYFNHLTAVGRDHLGAEFRLNSAIISRTTAVAAIFGEDGYILRSPTGLSALEEISDLHLPRNTSRTWSQLEPSERLVTIYLDLHKFRKEWAKNGSRKPINGRSEISDLLAMDNPMIAVTRILEHLRDRKSKIRKWARSSDAGEVNVYYATALRKLVLVHFLGQTALRIGMVPLITVGRPGCHLQWPSNGKPRLTIPPALFKNAGSEAFKSGPYIRDLEDRDGFYADLKEYLEVARPRLLDGNTADNLFLSWSAKGGGQAVSVQVTRGEVTGFTADAIGINAPPERRLIRHNHLRPHHFRDILATSVLRKTNRNFALAGDAIHVTEETARNYNALDTVEQRRPDLQKILAGL